ncbi:hypothetical protein BDV93DRAFT_607379 [Ceratobasidium sp. AG-I]|nr:hypothetical protein BDV93DRAFT_607379 [Ceratobasidium sp. AG-I]
MFYHAQRSHLVQSLDRLCYVYITYSYLISPSLLSLAARLLAQYRITVLKDVQPAHSLRFHLVILFCISIGPLSKDLFAPTPGSGVLLDFVGRSTPSQRLQGLATDILLIICQLVQLTIAYESARWAPEVPDPLFTPPLLPEAPAPPEPKLKVKVRERRSRGQPSHSRTTRAGYRDVLVRRSRHVRTSTAAFSPDTAIIDLPLRTLVRLLTRSTASSEESGLPGPATQIRQRAGTFSDLVAALVRMRAARQAGTQG